MGDQPVAQSDLGLPDAERADRSDEMTEWSDAEIVAACLEEDERAWRVLLDRYSRLIYTIPLRFGFSKSVADEIFQEVCLALLEGQDALREHDRIRAWFVTVTRRTCIRRIRQRKRAQFVDLEDHAEETAVDEAVEEDLVRIEEQYLIHRALEGLPSRCRRLLKALFFTVPTPSYEEIADQFDMPVGSVGPTRARCLEKLRRKVEALRRRGE